MSEHNGEVWAELERLSRRMARIEIALTERILRLEAEVKALKKAAEPICTDSVEQYEEPVEIDQGWLDANLPDWCEEGAAQAAIAEIMQG
jgi:hypothetical protein